MDQMSSPGGKGGAGTGSGVSSSGNPYASAGQGNLAQTRQQTFGGGTPTPNAAPGGKGGMAQPQGGFQSPYSNYQQPMGGFGGFGDFGQQGGFGQPLVAVQRNAPQLLPPQGSEYGMPDFSQFQPMERRGSDYLNPNYNGQGMQPNAGFLPNGGNGGGGLTPFSPEQMQAFRAAEMQSAPTAAYTPPPASSQTLTPFAPAAPAFDPNSALRQLNSRFGELKNQYGEDALRANGLTPTELRTMQGSLRGLMMDNTSTPEQHKAALDAALARMNGFFPSGGS